MDICKIKGIERLNARDCINVLRDRNLKDEWWKGIIIEKEEKPWLTDKYGFD